MIYSGRFLSLSVIPAKAGTQREECLAPRLRGDDGMNLIVTQ
jgi:hypothetical protein